MNLDNLRILSVLPVLGHPRDSKRITMIQKLGFSVEAVAFERKYHRGRLPDCPVEILGMISHGRYLKRCFTLATVIPILRRSIRRNHVVYASGPDMAAAALIANIGLNRPVIVEVGDIRNVQVVSGLRGYIVRKLDRFIVNACRLLVATAPGFVDGYYRQWLRVKTQALVLENKLESQIAGDNHLEIPQTVKGRPLVDRPLRIGYFGILRCAWSWKVLEALATARPNQIEIIVAGIPMEPPDLPERAAKKANIEFRGPYRSPQDLSVLYGSVDLVWGCYPSPKPEDWNWRWARTNRFYESCFFKRPIIALAGSGDATEIERYRIGTVLLPSASIEETLGAISSITSSTLTRWKENLSKLPINVYLYTREFDELERVVREIACSRCKTRGYFG